MMSAQVERVTFVLRFHDAMVSFHAFDRVIFSRFLAAAAAVALIIINIGL